MSHITDFAHSLVSARGPRHVNEIWAMFANLGHGVPGHTVDEQKENFAKAVSADPRLAVSDGIVMVKPDDKPDEKTGP